MKKIDGMNMQRRVYHVAKTLHADTLIRRIQQQQRYNRRTSKNEHYIED